MQAQKLIHFLFISTQLQQMFIVGNCLRSHGKSKYKTRTITLTSHDICQQILVIMQSFFMNLI